MASVKDVTQLFKPAPIFNNPDGSLPFALFNPDKVLAGRLQCMIGEDEEKRITKVFYFEYKNETTGKYEQEKEVEYLENINQARYVRDELRKVGWLDIKPPEVTFTQSDGSQTTVNRKQKRKIAKDLLKKK